MARHTLSHADELFAGSGVSLALNGAKRGISLVMVHREVIQAAALDTDGVIAAAVTPGPGAVTLNGALVTAGVATMDVARALQAVSTNAGDTTQTLTLTGTDIAGETISEDIALNGTTPVLGQKAFKTVTAASLSAVLAGNLNVGTTDILGLSVRVLNAYDVLFTLVGSTGAADAGTLVVADQTLPATNTTNDRRGTYDPAFTPNGTEQAVIYYVPDLTADAYGNRADL